MQYVLMDNKRILIRLIVVLLGAILGICWLPYLLTQFSILDFSATGQIGDTIGGIMGPFVGILAAVLTFMAFWTQYQANKEQRSSINENKAEIQKQQQRYEIDRFESKWLMLFDIYKETVKSLNCANIAGKAVFKELLDELRLVYELVEYGYAKWVKSEFCHEKQEHEDSVMAFQSTLVSDDKMLRLFLTETAYILFFYGKPYYSEMVKKNPGKIIVIEQIYAIISKIECSISKTTNRTFSLFTLYDGVASYRYCAPQSVLRGESYQLSLYFRVLFSLVSYIDNADIKGVGYQEKYEYLKLLRCQMSDEEQALLYYHSISPIGLEWNMKENNGSLLPDPMGLIAKYRLVKNLSPRFAFFGINPLEYYDCEMKYYEKNGKQFFEHESFDKYPPKIYFGKMMNGVKEEIKIITKFK